MNDDVYLIVACTRYDEACMASTSASGVGDCATALGLTDAWRNASAVVGPIAAIRTLSQWGTSAWCDMGGIAKEGKRQCRQLGAYEIMPIEKSGVA